MRLEKVFEKPLFYFLLIFSIATITLSAIFLFLYSIRKESTLEVLMMEEEVRSEAKFNIVREELRAIQTDILMLEKLFNLKDKDKAADFNELKKEFWFFSESQRRYSFIRFINNAGYVKIMIQYDGKSSVIFDESYNAYKGNTSFFLDSQVLEKGEIFVSKFELDISEQSEGSPQRPITRYIIPAYDKKGIKAGIIVLHYMNDLLVNRLLGVRSKSGSEFFILDIEGNYILKPSSDFGLWNNGQINNENDSSDINNSTFDFINSKKQGQYLNGDGLYTFTKITPLTFVNESINSERLEYLRNTLPPREYTLVSFIPIKEIDNRIAEFRRDYIVFYIVLLLILAALTFGLTLLRERRIALIKTNKKYRIFMESTLDSIIIVNSMGKIVEMNNMAERMFGFSAAELIGNNIEMLVPENNINHSELRKDYINNPKRIIVNDYRTDLNAIQKGGFEFPVEISLSPVIIDDEQFTMAVVRDITERKIAEKKLKESENRFRQIFNSANDIMFLQELTRSNHPGRFVEVNEAATKHLGYSREEFLNLKVYDLHRHEYLAELSIIHGNLLKDDNIKYEIPYLRKDGSEIILEESSHIVQINDRKFVLSISRDITEKKLSEEKLLESREKLKELNSAKDRFFSIISHDLRSPFWGMIGLSDLLLDPESDLSTNEKNKIIQDLNTSIKTQYNLLDDLLKWSQIQMGRLKIDKGELIVNTVIGKTIHQLERQILNKEINIILSLKEMLVLISDENIILSILRNVLSNAIKFTPRKSNIFIRTYVENTFAVIEVEDTGLGMTQDQQKKLFRMDTVFTSSGTDEEKGTGLGLILVKEMLDKIDGKIKFESEPNKGTKVTVYLPR